jgi:hypothetical protein
MVRKNLPYRIGIPLLGKGGTTHLHRKALVDAFWKENIDVCFLVREDYLPLLDQIRGCQYIIYRPPEIKQATLKKIVDVCQSLRQLYPSRDDFRRWRYRNLKKGNPSFLGRTLHSFQFYLATFQWTLRVLAYIEGIIYRSLNFDELNRMELDQLLILGYGSSVDTMSLPLDWWGIKNRISVIHFIGNYDSLSSKGFRGHPIQNIVVWGPNMRRDAKTLQGISEDRIEAIGSIRYNDVDSYKKESREDFFLRRGLDPSAKTILFAGFIFEFHYFEMISILDELKEKGLNLQLIQRIYPNKRLLRSPLMEALIKQADSRQDIHVSLADPFYREGEKDRPVLQIEEEELLNILRYSDVVINVFSTIALEACIFDKPGINLWYFPKVQGLLRDPVYLQYPLQWHIQRLLSYGALNTANSRLELISLIQDALADPGRNRQQRMKLVEEECGPLDGKAAARLAVLCSKLSGQSR